MDPYAHVPGMVDLSTMGERVTFKSSTGPNLTGVIDVPDRAMRGGDMSWTHMTSWSTAFC